MPKPIDPAIRSALFRLADEGVGPAPAARRLGIGESSVRRLLLFVARSRDSLPVAPVGSEFVGLIKQCTDCSSDFDKLLGEVAGNPIDATAKSY